MEQPITQLSSIKKKHAFLIFKVALFLATLLFLGKELIRRFGPFNWKTAEFNLFLVSFSGMVILSALALSIFKYRSLISGLQTPPAWKVIMQPAWISPIAKYIPGKLASVIGAVWLLCDAGMKVPVATEVVLLAQGLQVCVGLVIAAPLTLWGPIREVLTYSWLWCSALVAAGALCMYPPMLARIVNLVLCRLGQPPLETVPRFRNYLIPIAISIAQAILGGFALWLMAYSLVPIQPASLPFFISASALANVSGYLAFFAPAGLGIRELVLIATLESFIGAAPIAILVLMMRLANVISECLLALVGFYARSRLRQAVDIKSVSGKVAN